MERLLELFSTISGKLLHGFCNAFERFLCDFWTAVGKLLDEVWTTFRKIGRLLENLSATIGGLVDDF